MITNMYSKNRNRGPTARNNCVVTPWPLASWIYSVCKDSLPWYQKYVVLDPCCGHGNLLLPWSDHKCIGVDKVHQSPSFDFAFYHDDFLELRQPIGKPDIILCNPPWNHGSKHDDPLNPKKMMLPEMFLRKIVSLYGRSMPLVLIVPIGFRFNQKRPSKRWQWIRDQGPELTGSVALPIDMFAGCMIHSEILFFNLDVRVNWLPDYVVN
jgi:hypothetical protein